MVYTILPFDSNQQFTSLPFDRYEFDARNPCRLVILTVSHKVVRVLALSCLSLLCNIYRSFTTMRLRTPSLRIYIELKCC